MFIVENLTPNQLEAYNTIKKHMRAENIPWSVALSDVVHAVAMTIADDVANDRTPPPAYVRRYAWLATQWTAEVNDPDYK